MRLDVAGTGELVGTPMAGHTKAVWDVAFSPDGRLIASAGHDARIRFWNAATGVQVGVLTGNKAMRAVEFSPDGSMVAGGSDDGMVYLWA